MRRHWLLLITMFALATAALAQSAPAASGNKDAEGKQVGGYQVQQSVEFGYRLTDINGSTPMYDTFTDLHEGARLLDQSLSMHALNNTGVLFDDLTMSSFGWGGDPENVARLRMSKHMAYDFNAIFRRDQNFSDYNLVGNPLNPVVANPALTIPVTFSPLETMLRRRMYDYNLTLLPQSKLTFRLGYSRNRNEGPSYVSFHEGTEPLLNQNWNVTSNDFRAGIDFKFLPKTVISYDQFVDLDKNDTDYSLAPFANFSTANGTVVSFGLPVYPPNYPCAAPLTNAGYASPTCNSYQAYTRNQRVRTTTPTEQLSLKSNYLNRVTFVARTSYSAASLDSTYAEFFQGLVTRTNERQFTFSGPAAVKRESLTSDLGMTVELTRSMNLSDDFRFDNWRIPGIWNSVNTTTGSIGASSLLSPLAATVVTSDTVVNFLSQRSFSNLMQWEYNATKRFGVRAGYRFRVRNIFKSNEQDLTALVGFVPFAGDSLDITEQGPVVGAWMRPTDSLRVNLEFEDTTADNFLTRISPRQKQNYRGRVNYRPLRWANLSGSVNWWEGRNGEADTQYKQHMRNYGVVASLLPNEHFGLDLSYNYTDALQDAYICYNGSFIAAGTAVNGCPTYSASANVSPNWIYSNYSNNTHFGSATLMFRPVKRVTANFGMGMTNVDGTTTILNALEPLGPLQYTYYQPLASLSYAVVKDVSVNAYWNYDQYNEGSFTGPTLPRYFHDNRTVLSMKYAF